MTKKTLTVKNMVEKYKNAKTEMQDLWDAFYMMYIYDFITYDEWHKFFNTCHAWAYDEEVNAVIDIETDKIVKQF